MAVGRAKVFVNETLTEEARAILKSFELQEGKASDEFLGKCEVLVGWPGRSKADLLGKMKSLRMFQSLSAGVDGLDFAALPPGVQVFSNAGAYSEPVAEHAWGLLLGTAKGVHVRNRRTTPRKLRSGVILVVGGGGIGSEVARLAKSISMTTVGVSRSFLHPENFDEMRPAADLDAVLGMADAVVLALPFTSATRGILDYRRLSMMKEAVVLVNVGRGDLVSEEGLLRWLRERPESRYATDVFWFKDGKENFETRAWELPNFAGTLHISGMPLGETLAGPKLAAVQNVKKFLEGGRARNRVDVSEYFNARK